MTERVCSDCDGLIDAVPAVEDPWDLDLMCVLCGAALTLGGLLLGEALAQQDEEHAA